MKFLFTTIMMILIGQRELDQWRKENRSLQLELRHEESLTAQVNTAIGANLCYGLFLLLLLFMLMVALTAKTTKSVKSYIQDNCCHFFADPSSHR